MRLFDFNVALGRFARPGMGCFDNAGDLSVELHARGISDALVYHALAAEADVERGNRLLLDKLGNAPHLHACWVMAPTYFDDLPKPDAWVRKARESNVKAVRIFPRQHLYSVAELPLSPLASALAEARMPLLIDFGPHHWSDQAIPWPAITRLALDHPALNIVVIGATVGDVRDAYSVVRNTANIHLETNAFIVPDLYGQFSTLDLSSRLVFGSGLPRRAAECAVHQLATCDIRKPDLNAVAGGNARRLLRLTDTTSTGNPLPFIEMPGVPIIDTHGHCGSWERTTTPLKTPDAFVRSMDRCGIDKLVFSSFSAIHGETRSGNAETAEWIRDFPERLYGYCVINPNFPGETDNELVECFEKTANFVGLKLHCQLHGAQLHDDGYKRALSYADMHKLPVLVHGGGYDKWDDVCALYANVNFIMAHACSWDGLDPAGRALFARAALIPNLYVDTAGSPAHRGALRALIDLVGIDKVLYGSDFPMFDFGFEVGRILRSDLPVEDKRAICSSNARHIFRTL